MQGKHWEVRAGRWGTSPWSTGTHMPICFSRHHAWRCAEVRKSETKPSILTRGRAPTKLLSVVLRKAPDNCLPPGLKKLLFPIRAEQTAQRAHGVTPSTAWVCVLLERARRCACLAAICCGPLPTSPHLSSHYEKYWLLSKLFGRLRELRAA